MSDTSRQTANASANERPSKILRETRTRVIVTMEGEIYQVLNPPAYLMPSIPGTNTVPFASHVRPYIQTPDEFNKRGWEYEGVLPYRGFVPVETAFHDGLFSCLGYTEGTMPLDRSDSGEWTIRGSLLDRWQYLQKLLLKLRDAFAPVGVSTEYVSV
ncbi:hypothetical protein C8J56DRAFT_1053645 [Mycena floridula]|nr:hypothetical protein C8J56DRAFT_1053645 [Mycena floridula]